MQSIDRSSALNACCMGLKGVTERKMYA